MNAKIKTASLNHKLLSYSHCLGALLKQHRISLAAAESCTGGLFSELITAVPGSSHYFLGGVVSYANPVKTKALGVDAHLLQKQGAVNEKVVMQMAQGVQRLVSADLAIALSGVAGPGGGSPSKPVGTVFCVIWASPQKFQVRAWNCPGARDQVRRVVSLRLLKNLIFFIKNYYCFK